MKIENLSIIQEKISLLKILDELLVQKELFIAKLHADKRIYDIGIKFVIGENSVSGKLIDILKDLRQETIIQLTDLGIDKNEFTNEAE